MNYYYILPLPNDHASIWDKVVQTSETVRKNLQGNKMIVKLFINDNQNYTVFNGRTKYTNSEILQYLEDNSSEWNETIDISQ